MGLSSKSLDLIIKTISRRLFEDENLMIRIKAAESLGKLGNEKAIIPLCQALDRKNDSEVIFAIMDAIIQIKESTKTMSDAPKNQFNFNAPLTNPQINAEGSQKQYNINNPKPKTPAETAKEIQDLLKQLKQGNPDLSEEILIQQVINNNPTLKQILTNALKQGGTEALKVFFPFVSIPVETIRGFIEA